MKLNNLQKGVDLERRGLEFNLSTKALVCSYPMHYPDQCHIPLSPSFAVGMTESKRRKCFSSRINRFYGKKENLYLLLPSLWTSLLTVSLRKGNQQMAHCYYLCGLVFQKYLPYSRELERKKGSHLVSV